MNFLVKKVVLFLLKRTENLKTAVNNAPDKGSPSHQRMKSLLEKRAMLEKAVNSDATLKKSSGKSRQRTGENATRFSNTIADSLAAKKAAMTPSKKARVAKTAQKNNQTRRGR